MLMYVPRVQQLMQEVNKVRSKYAKEDAARNKVYLVIVLIVLMVLLCGYINVLIVLE